MFEGIPTPALVGLGILVSCQLVLQIFALVDLARRKRVATGRKWLWAVIILAGQLIGPIVYFACGRLVEEAVDLPGTAGSVHERSEEALDVLYGKRERR